MKENYFWSYAFYDHPLGVKGALVRAEDEHGHFGVADLCPWTHLGDCDLSLELATQGPLFLRSQSLAIEDLIARKEKRRLYSDVIIKNHVLVRDWQTFVSEEPLSLDQEIIYKFKCGREYIRFADWLNQHGPGLGRIRIDFNAQLSAQQFREFISRLKDSVLEQIDFIEDPTPFSLAEWTEFALKVKIAGDFEGAEYPVRINKPSREDYDPKAICITSAMDHPVGHLHALRFAQLHPQLIHGFSTIELFRNSNYFKYFQFKHEELSLQNDGYGIGLDEALSRENYAPDIDWVNSSKTQLIIDPGLSAETRATYFRIRQQFVERHGENYLLLASSGSTAQLHQQKLFAFEKRQVLAAAQRVVDHFKMRPGAVMGSVLPYFHVAGLSVLARAYVLNSKIVQKNWKEVNREWFDSNQIEVISLVPTQIFDIVDRNWTCPPKISHVFVGAGALSNEIYQKAKALGWPLIPTYGMTETIGMIATANLDTDPAEYELLGGVEFIQPIQKTELEHEIRRIQLKGLASFQILAEHDRIETISPLGHRPSDGSLWPKQAPQPEAAPRSDAALQPNVIELPDIIELVNDRKFKFIGRKDDQIKIKGELVNIARIQTRVQSYHPTGVTVIDVDDRRSGKKLVLVFDQSLMGLRTDNEGLALLISKINTGLRPFEHIQHFVVLPQFPRTALGKIRMQELKSLIGEGDIHEIRKV